MRWRYLFAVRCRTWNGLFYVKMNEERKNNDQGKSLNNAQSLAKSLERSLWRTHFELKHASDPEDADDAMDRAIKSLERDAENAQEILFAICDLNLNKD